MFRLWSSDSRGSQQSIDTSKDVFSPSLQPSTPSTPPPTTDSPSVSPKAQPPKRKLDNLRDADSSFSPNLAKRARHVHDLDSSPLYPQDPLDRARDEIRHHFGLEILLKHDELRLINQELAKCQIALEQLRRCHLIPYPVNLSTPEQMLQVCDGKGPALANHPAEPAPKWAPPFGVVDGPYARHYAKWLIPDPAFDGMQPEWPFSAQLAAPQSSCAEGRTTRNSLTDTSCKGRSHRAMSGQRLQSLSSGYPQPKDKAGPCILKRSDGQTVKLVCLDCNRENFSSTQGFINHCRIAHKRDFKSHEEAAVHSGQPVDAAPEPRANSNASPIDDKPAPPSSTCASTHPLNAVHDSQQEALASVRRRIAVALKLYSATEPLAGGVAKQKQKADNFKPAANTPYLSRFMEDKKFNGNLDDIVTDAKTKVCLDEAPGYESDDALGRMSGDAPTVGPRVIMRTPASSSPAPMVCVGRPASSKGRTPRVNFSFPPHSSIGSGLHGGLSDDDMAMREDNLSPSTMVSNNAPSLVSDDGEYDDSDEGASETSDHVEAESVSDVAEIALDDEHETRSLRRGSGSDRPRKEDGRHVTFIGPVKPKSTKQRRCRRI